MFAAFFVIFYTLSGDLTLFREVGVVDKTLISGDLILIVFLVASTVGYPLAGWSTVYLLSLFWHFLSACVMYVMVFSPVWSE